MPVHPLRGAKSEGVGAAQVSLLVLLSVFTGSMVGLERTLASLLAKNVFAVASTTVALSFLITFGLAKCFANLGAGHLADLQGRRRILIAGWLVAIPVPLLVIWAPSWWIVVAANVLLGVNQGLAWSMALNMKIDHFGERRRGLAVGLNESFGYAGVAALAYAAAVLATAYGLRPVPFLVAEGVAVVGLALSLATRETRARQPAGTEPAAFLPALQRGLGGDRGLTAASIGGFATNMKEGLIWGLLPLLLVAQDIPLTQVGVVVALGPLVWALAQLGTGPLSDLVGRKPLIVAGFVVQGVGLAILALVPGIASAMAAAVILGMGTGMVYPTLIAQVSDASQANARATAIGVYRFVRDFGYVGGALIGGVVADLWGLENAILAGAPVVLIAALVGALAPTSTVAPAMAPLARSEANG